jgi:hypothetical protein
MEKHILKTAAGILISLALLFAPLPAYTWSVTGHQTIALIAQSQLTPATQVEINRLLALEPGSTLESIASWADQNRDSSNTRWHYVNFPRGDCHYQRQRDCPDGQCVVEAIKAQYAIYHSKAPDTERLIALKFLVHLVGDIHQPLHAGFGDDRGGNTYQIQYRSEGTNLHALWDYAMVEQFERSPVALARMLESSHSVDPGPIVAMDAALWAEQSCQIVSRPGFYPGRQVNQEYMRDYAPIVALQLLRAGTRLAALLN